MNISTIDIIWYLVLILTVNIVGLQLIKNEKKYMLLSLPLWTFFLLFFIFTIAYNNSLIHNLQTAYNNSFGDKSYGDHNIWMELWKTEIQAAKLNILMLRLFGIQTGLTLIFQAIGLRQTSFKKLYRRTFIFLLIATISYLCLEFLMSVVPKTGFVT